MSVIDTNVLVHSSVPESPLHLVARAAFHRLASAGPVAVTRQALREFLSVTTRPQSWTKAATLADATRNTDGFMQRFLVFMQRFLVLDDGQDVWDELMALSRRFAFGGKQVHDANIVATMLAYGEARLLTFNACDFRRFEPLIEVIEP